MEQVKKPWLKFCGCVPESLEYPDCTMAEAVEKSMITSAGSVHLSRLS